MKVRISEAQKKQIAKHLNKYVKRTDAIVSDVLTGVTISIAESAREDLKSHKTKLHKDSKRGQIYEHSKPYATNTLGGVVDFAKTMIAHDSNYYEFSRGRTRKIWNTVGYIKIAKNHKATFFKQGHIGKVSGFEGIKARNQSTQDIGLRYEHGYKQTKISKKQRAYFARSGLRIPRKIERKGTNSMGKQSGKVSGLIAKAIKRIERAVARSYKNV